MNIVFWMRLVHALLRGVCWRFDFGVDGVGAGMVSLRCVFCCWVDDCLFDKVQIRHGTVVVE